MIILEGIDKTGKTTLANKLRDEYGYEIVKTSQPKKKEHPYVEYVRKILSIRTSRVVFDRLHLGELVYGPVKRGKSLIDEKMLFNINSLLSLHGATIIYCHDKPEIIKERFSQEKEDYLQETDIETILKRYEEVIQTTISHGVKVITHRVSNKQYQVKVKNLAYQDDLCLSSLLKRRVRGSGISPKVLFVGECFSSKNLRPFTIEEQLSSRLPFDFGYSTHLFFELEKIMRKHGISYAVTNARKVVDGKVEVGIKQELFDLNGNNYLRVICILGKKAEKLVREDCEKSALPYFTIEHPSFLLRFKRDEQEEYLKKALRKIKKHL